MNLNTSSLKTLAIALLAEIDDLSNQDEKLSFEALSLEQPLNFYETIREFEKRIIKKALIITNGNQTKAARLLGLNLSTLNTKIKAYGIELSKLEVG